jgi:hypothetical protein
MCTLIGVLWNLLPNSRVYVPASIVGSNRVLELTPEGPHQYGGGYTEYVARTGQQAPGLRS